MRERRPQADDGATGGGWGEQMKKHPGSDQTETLSAALACAQWQGLVGSLGMVGQRPHRLNCISFHGGNVRRDVVVVGSKGEWAALMAMGSGMASSWWMVSRGMACSDGV